jgi:hypothetical protein
MLKCTVIFLALLHGINGETVPVASAEATTTFPDEESCRAAGEIIYGSLAARVDAVLRTTGVGVLHGARIYCKPDGGAI